LQKIGVNNGVKRVMFVGRIEPLKGIDSLLYALKIMTKRQPELAIELWVVGGDVSQPVESWSQELRKLERVRRQLGLEAQVKFMGQQTQELLPYYFQVADVVVMPSHYESFGMVALEAMACGVPVITTNVAGISDILDDHHKDLLTTVNNPLLLAKQIEKLLADPQYHAHVSRLVRERVQDLSWTNIAARIKTYYQKLLSK
jgi:D-inositol-3-phosphate glycosyltransferase